MPVSVREHRDGARRVVTDAREGEERIHLSGYSAPMPGRDLLRRAMEPESAPRVPEIRPLLHDIGRGGRREVVRSGPAVEPGVEARDDAAHRSLLEHELADQHPPRAEPFVEVRATPGEIPGVLAIPTQERPHDVLARNGVEEVHRTSLGEWTGWAGDDGFAPSCASLDDVRPTAAPP
jgi:hypothetical protein